MQLLAAEIFLQNVSESVLCDVESKKRDFSEYSECDDNSVTSEFCSDTDDSMSNSKADSAGASSTTFSTTNAGLFQSSGAKGSKNSGISSCRR
jgi:hypothetical protein